MINPGKYKAKAISGEFGVSGLKKTELVRVAFEITAGEAAGESIAWDGFFTEKTEERTLEALRHCGCTFPANDITDLEGLGSTEVQLVIEDEEYEGKQRARVKWVNALVGGIKDENKLDESAKRALCARMKANIAASRKGAPAPNGSRSQAPASGGSASSETDDIPF